MTTNTDQLSSFDPYHMSVVEQREVLAEARKHAPAAHFDGYGGFWLLSRHADVDRALHNHEELSSAKWQEPDGTWRGGDRIPSRQSPAMLVLETDPPQWREQRAVLTSFFTPNATRGRHVFLEELVDGLLDRVIESGRINFCTDLAYAVPTMTTLHLVGLPLDEWERFHTSMHKLIHFPPDSEEHHEGFAEHLWTAERLRELLLERREHPADDMASRVAAAELSGAPIDIEDAVNMLRTVIGGGVDTTGSTLLAMFRHLDGNHADRDRLIADRGLVPKAVDEVLRMWPPAPLAVRSASQPLELHGKAIDTRETVGLSIMSANRDETVFERPDEVVLDRSPNPHLSFGAGIHFCLGRNLARAELEIVLDRVLDRIPDFVIDRDAEDIPRRQMPATFTPGSKKS
ncbi:cytochrome P450 [Nocardia sp. alder85J]|uniref:cytochrome P450 n=1 Tax=Nocardia sp. alder85J TaxID=2862949 RepID=UPI001CD689F0|nr:cytochrome P450 [Nocardia sp. alder85J]MCX4095600.1 cytochrome P450 [Nocardia sp. alder85J]